MWLLGPITADLATKRAPTCLGVKNGLVLHTNHQFCCTLLTTSDSNATQAATFALSVFLLLIDSHFGFQALNQATLLVISTILRLVGT